VLLVMDVGNTRTKWALADEAGTLTELEVCMNADIATSNLSAIAQKVDKVLIASVAGDAMAKQLAKLLAPLQPEFVTVTKQACGVVNSSYPTLGADRWAALIAVRHRIKQAVLVVNAGTAVTIDALDSRGLFLGGTIMPGLRLMQATLAKNTAKLNVGEGVMQDFPKNTQDAIQTGCLNAVAGAVGVMLKRLEKHSGWLPKLVMSGGDATKIAEVLNLNTKQVIIMEYLVLQGIVLLEKESR